MARWTCWIKSGSGSLACRGKGSEFAEGLGESETGFEYHGGEQKDEEKVEKRRPETTVLRIN